MRRRILIPYLNLKHRSKSYPLKETYVKRTVFFKKFFVLNFSKLFVDVLTTIAKIMKYKSQPFNVHFLPLLGYLVTRPFMVYAIWQGICFNFILIRNLKSIVGISNLYLNIQNDREFLLWLRARIFRRQACFLLLIDSNLNTFPKLFKF